MHLSTTLEQAWSPWETPEAEEGPWNVKLVGNSSLESIMAEASVGSSTDSLRIDVHKVPDSSHLLCYGC